MEIGLLWYDDTQMEFAAKVHQVVQRYEEKFGTSPNRCYVNPASLPKVAKAFSLNGINVVTCAAVLPNHFWVGLEGQNRNVSAETSEVGCQSEQQITSRRF